MTDKEIIKALEHHQKRRCSECPLRDNETSCSATISTLALDLINRQQAEIVRLKSMNQAKLDAIHDLQAENEALNEKLINVLYWE